MVLAVGKECTDEIFALYGLPVASYPPLSLKAEHFAFRTFLYPEKETSQSMFTFFLSPWPNRSDVSF
jgi:hypothetical protein